MSGIRLSRVCIVVALHGCGAGSDGSDPCADPVPLHAGELAFAQATPQQTQQSSLAAFGNGFVPADSACEVVAHLGNPNDPFSAPVAYSCRCSTVAPVCVTWKNEASGASGRGTYQVRSGTVEVSGVPIAVCGPVDTRWNADIPLVAGLNRLVVTMTDGQRGGIASFTVTRN